MKSISQGIVMPAYPIHRYLISDGSIIRALNTSSRRAYAAHHSPTVIP